MTDAQRIQALELELSTLRQQQAETQQERDRETEQRRAVERTVLNLEKSLTQALAREPYANEYDNMERAISEAFGWTQTILGLDDAGDDPDDLVSNLSLINERSRALQERFATLQASLRSLVAQWRESANFALEIDRTMIGARVTLVCADQLERLVPLPAPPSAGAGA